MSSASFWRWCWSPNTGSRRGAGSAAGDAYRGAEWAAGYFDEFHRAVRVDWRAYVEWWQRPVAGAFVTIDARGLRPTPGEESAAPDAVRILCFGGSTMMGMGARDAHTIPAMLARRLGELGHRVAVTNYGQLGHNTTQETITLQRLLKAGERIDIAVFYDGVNEMACAEQTGRADGLFNEANRRAEFNLLHPDRRRDLVAAAADLARIDLEALARAVIETYAQNLRLIRMLGREYGFAPVFFWQPVITTKRVRSPDEQRWARDYTRDPENRTRLYRAIIDERRRRPDLAAAPDAHDLSALFDDWAEPVYIDLYHLSERGNAAVAEAMLPAVAAAVEARVAAGRGL